MFLTKEYSSQRLKLRCIKLGSTIEKYPNDEQRDFYSNDMSLTKPKFDLLLLPVFETIIHLVSTQHFPKKENKILHT